MRKGLFGAYELGALSAMSKLLKNTEQHTGEKACDIESLFYATAFQAGIDQFLLPTITDMESPRSEFVRARTAFIERGQPDAYWTALRQSFSRHLPAGWERDDKFSNVWAWIAFLADLFTAMEEGASLLAVSYIPDPSKVEALLPSELLVPLSNLAGSFQNIAVPSIVPANIITKESIERFQTVILSDMFSGYVGAQETLGDERVTVTGAVDRVLGAGREIVKANPQLLAIRRSVVGILSVTPKLIDAVFGKLPGALAEVAAKLGINFFENRHRVVVYDFQPLVEKLVLTNLVRMMSRPGLN